MMTSNLENRELKERLDLIESMIAEGRQATGNWGWVFILWGVAYYVAIAWASSGWNPVAAWPVTMIAAGVVTGLVKRRGTRNPPRTGSRGAIGSIWMVVGSLLLVLMMSLGFSGRLDSHISLAVVGTMLAVANGASSVILKWKMQFACALVWLGAAEVGCFGTATQGLVMFLAATFFCQIIFGIYVMMTESRRRVRGAAHA